MNTSPPQHDSVPKRSGPVRLMIASGLVSMALCSMLELMLFGISFDFTSVFKNAFFATMFVSVLVAGRELIDDSIFWVLDAFPKDRRDVIRERIIQTAKALPKIVLVLVALVYFRFDVVSAHTYAKDRVEFLVWDRWTGETRVYYQSKDMRIPREIPRDS